MGHREIHLVILLIFHIASGYLTNTWAQGNCDPSLVKMSEGPLAYKDRGDRCEGIYIKEVGSTTLQVASLTESFESYNLESGKPLIIKWQNPPGNNNVRIRAQGLKRKLYYRMDSNRPAGDISYSWSTNFLASLNIVKSDIGIFARSPSMVGGVERNVYIPLRINQEENNVRKDTYKLILLPGVELREIYIGISFMTADGHQGKIIMDGKKLGYGYYPADRGIEIPVSGLGEPGIYYLEIGAELKNGGTSTLEIWFYHSTK